MTPALVKRLAEGRIRWLEKRSAEVFESAVKTLLEFKKYRKDTFWSKPRPLTEEEARAVMVYYVKNDYFPREYNSEEFGYSLIHSRRLDCRTIPLIRDEWIPDMKRLIRIADLVAQDCEMYIDIATAALLQPHAED
jgi:hypothetical protein